MSWADDEGYYWDEDMEAQFNQLPHFEYEVGYWETGDGNRVAISKMEVSHIKNCMAWLERAKEKATDQDDLLEIDAKLEEFQEELERRSTFNNKELF